jgi:hypothetical protein
MTIGDNPLEWDYEIGRPFVTMEDRRNKQQTWIITATKEPPMDRIGCIYASGEEGSMVIAPPKEKDHWKSKPEILNPARSRSSAPKAWGVWEDNMIQARAKSEEPRAAPVEVTDDEDEDMSDSQEGPKTPIRMNLTPRPRTRPYRQTPSTPHTAHRTTKERTESEKDMEIERLTALLALRTPTTSANRRFISLSSTEERATSRVNAWSHPGTEPATIAPTRERSRTPDHKELRPTDIVIEDTTDGW